MSEILSYWLGVLAALAMVWLVIERRRRLRAERVIASLARYAVCLERFEHPVSPGRAWELDANATDERPTPEEP